MPFAYTTQSVPMAVTSLMESSRSLLVAEVTAGIPNTKVIDTPVLYCSDRSFQSTVRIIEQNRTSPQPFL